MLKRPLLMVVLLLPFLAIPVAAFAAHNSNIGSLRAGHRAGLWWDMIGWVLPFIAMNLAGARTR